MNDQKEESVLKRLNIGHNHLTHVNFLQREEKPKYFGQGCNEYLTIEHLLIKCD